MANNSKQCFNTHYQSHCHPTTKSLWLCSSVYCRPPHQSRRIWLVAAATNQKSQEVGDEKDLCKARSYHMQRGEAPPVRQLHGPHMDNHGLTARPIFMQGGDVLAWPSLSPDPCHSAAVEFYFQDNQHQREPIKDSPETVGCCQWTVGYCNSSAHPDGVGRYTRLPRGVTHY